MTLHYRRNSLYTSLLFGTTPLAMFLEQPRHKCRQLDQINRTEIAAPGRELQERISRRQARPRSRNGDQLSVVVVVVGSVLAPIVSMLDESELLPTKRMEGMSDIERFCFNVTIECIPQGIPIPTPNGG